MRIRIWQDPVADQEAEALAVDLVEAALAADREEALVADREEASEDVPLITDPEASGLTIITFSIRDVRDTTDTMGAAASAVCSA